MPKYKIKNWETYQQYKDRNPAWIKLHVDLLDDPDYHELKAEDAKYLILIWLAAAKHKEDGELPPLKKLAYQLHITEEKIMSILAGLSHWIITDCTEAYGKVQNRIPEGEGEGEKEKEKTRTQKSEKINFAEFVTLLPAEHEKLCSEYGASMTNTLIETLNNYKGAHGKTYKSDYRAILSWVVEKVKEKKGKTVNDQMAAVREGFPDDGQGAI